MNTLNAAMAAIREHVKRSTHFDEVRIKSDEVHARAVHGQSGRGWRFVGWVPDVARAALVTGDDQW